MKNNKIKIVILAIYLIIISVVAFYFYALFSFLGGVHEIPYYRLENLRMLCFVLKYYVILAGIGIVWFLMTYQKRKPGEPEDSQEGSTARYAFPVILAAILLFGAFSVGEDMAGDEADRLYQEALQRAEEMQTPEE